MTIKVQSKIVGINKSGISLVEDIKSRVRVNTGHYLHPVTYHKMDNTTFHVYIRVLIIENRPEYQIQLPLQVSFQVDSSAGQLVAGYKYSQEAPLNEALPLILSELFLATVWMAMGMFYQLCSDAKIPAQTFPFLTYTEAVDVVKRSLKEHGINSLS